MTEIQILDLQLVPDNYYWALIQLNSDPEVIYYCLNEDTHKPEIYIPGTQDYISTHDIESIDPNQITYTGSVL